jgi:hypothetical protein
MPIQDHESRVHDEPNRDDEGKHNGDHEIQPAVVVAHVNERSRAYFAGVLRGAGNVTAPSLTLFPLAHKAALSL